MKPLALIISLLCAACATKPSVLPTPPPKAKPVAPEVSVVREKIADAGQQVAVIDAGAKEARLAATKAREEAERLKAQKSANEAELTKLWQDLQSVEARNLFLEMETDTLSAQIGVLRDLAAKAEQSAAAKDAEAEQLRAVTDQLTAAVKAADKEANKARAEAVKQRTRADKLAGEIRIYRWLLWPVGIGAVLLILGWIVLKWFLPPSATESLLNRILSLNR